MRRGLGRLRPDLPLAALPDLRRPAGAGGAVRHHGPLHRLHRQGQHHAPPVDGLQAVRRLAGAGCTGGQLQRLQPGGFHRLGVLRLRRGAAGGDFRRAGLGSGTMAGAARGNRDGLPGGVPHLRDPDGDGPGPDLRPDAGPGGHGGAAGGQGDGLRQGAGNGLCGHAVSALRPEPERLRGAGLRSAAAAGVSLLAVLRGQGRHHGVGALGRHHPGRRLLEQGHELLQPLRLRLRHGLGV